MNLLSIQSHVAYGHVGNAAAVFPLQRLGVEVWPVHTVQFSNHPGYGTFSGETFAPGQIRAVVQGLAERGLFGECDGILSGYVGSAAIGEAILDAVDLVKVANPSARYCCDPVIGDFERGVYVDAGVPEFFAQRALPRADLITPNQFELDYLSGSKSATVADALDAIRKLRDRGPRLVLATSMRTGDTPDESLDLIAADDTGVVRVRTPLLPVAVHGAGDAIAALFFMHHLRTSSIGQALSHAASSIFGILNQTAEAGLSEMLLIEAQEELVTPSTVFPAQPIAP